MKLFFKFITCMLLSQFCFFSCQDEKKTGDLSGTEVAIYVRMKIPPTSHKTRAVEESVINTINILVFEDTGEGYEYAYNVSGYSLTDGDEEDTYDFRARIVASENPLKLYFLANVSGIAAIPAGSSEEEVKELLTADFTFLGFTTYLPMFGEEEFTSGITTVDTSIDVTMVRSVARIDIQNTAAEFTLTSVYAYRANSLYQIIPDLLVADTVSEASVPATSNRNVIVGPFDVTGELFSEELYLPESPVVSPADQLTATTIVIGGIYDGDTQETYYRMDFIPDNDPDIFGQILRNHRYLFTITEVLAPGWNDPDEAANNNSSDITAEIKEWNENTLYMAFDEANYFGVSSRTIIVGFSEGASNSIEVDTNVEEYFLYWLDEAGNIDETISPVSISLGETFDNDLFSVSINDSGDRITATALTNLDPEVDSISSRLRVEANRLRINLTIIQQRPEFMEQYLKIYNSTQEFTFGNNTLGNGTFAASDRTRPMITILNNRDNFGPSGTVPVSGISISAQDRVDFPENLLELFDVLYLTYNRNPSTLTSGYIVNWLNTNNRTVLILSYDNENSNPTLLSLLNITGRIQSSNRSAFTFYEDAPAEIMNGFFGTVPYDLTIRCYDTTHGEIPENVARANGISPILRGGSGEMVFGIDLTKRIIYCGDVDIFNNLPTSNPGSTISSTAAATGVITNDVDVFIANLWAWITEVALGEREE